MKEASRRQSGELHRIAQTKGRQTSALTPKPARKKSQRLRIDPSAKPVKENPTSSTSPLENEDTEPYFTFVHLSRVFGRIRFILDYFGTTSVMVPTFIGHVFISLLPGRRDYRIGLIWPHGKRRLSHDYVISRSKYAKISKDKALIIDGLIAAVMRTLRKQQAESRSKH